jgi:hypothetical protein
MENDVNYKAKRESLIYELIFSKNEEFEIVVSDYILDIYTYDKFIISIKTVLVKSSVVIISEKIKTTPKTVLWKIKVRK